MSICGCDDTLKSFRFPPLENSSSQDLGVKAARNVKHTRGVEYQRRGRTIRLKTIEDGGGTLQIVCGT